ncbi:MAG: hypothetical protein QT05_C0048G0014 [archaeon GW2011_AR13]|nr:MAG: hypothetical protein QT05_C0048G0014 [archaeon GW2011_AR13]HIG94858.1 hypothetical protein [Nanoarchaeota archaeon]HIH63973.1 hypothetical protein [Nanoarchaeota archaeon]HIJ09685.1 hypothetical protein [Nanoarchaeota archaeon]
MVKEAILTEEKAIYLGQLIDSLQEAELRLEESYEKKDYAMFNKLKKYILDVQGRMDQTLK